MSSSLGEGGLVVRLSQVGTEQAVSVGKANRGWDLPCQAKQNTDHILKQVPIPNGTDKGKQNTHHHWWCWNDLLQGEAPLRKDRKYMNSYLTGGEKRGEQ